MKQTFTRTQLVR